MALTSRMTEDVAASFSSAETPASDDAAGD
jgi:hypothetical protein